MAIKIKLEKTFNKGVRGYTFLGGNALEDKELPSEYLQERPYLYREKVKRKGELVLLPDPKGCVIFSPGKFFTEKRMKELLLEISKAGKRLQKINGKIREEKKTWHGQVEIII